jgi:lambda repressor-like predicted transcriptional regulator
MTRLSKGVGVHYATVKRWAAGDLPVPEYAAAAIELLEAAPASTWPARFAPPTKRPGRPRKTPAPTQTAA